jgi:hypothetical protein
MVAEGEAEVEAEAVGEERGKTAAELRESAAAVTTMTTAMTTTMTAAAAAAAAAMAAMAAMAAAMAGTEAVVTMTAGGAREERPWGGSGGVWRHGGAAEEGPCRGRVLFETAARDYCQRTEEEGEYGKEFYSSSSEEEGLFGF